MKLAEFRRKVNARSGLALSDSVLEDIINEALIQVNNEADWPWLRLTTTSTWTTDATTLAFPADCKAVRILDVADGNPYELMTPAQMANRFTSGDRGRGLAVEGTTITPYPTPADGASYTLHYVAFEQLNGDGEESLIPDQWADVVINLACSIAHDRPEGNEKAGSRYQQRYHEAMRRMKRSVLKPTRGAQVPRGRGDVL